LNKAFDGRDEGDGIFNDDFDNVNLQDDDVNGFMNNDDPNNLNDKNEDFNKFLLDDND